MAARVNKKEALEILRRVVARHGEKTTYAKRDRGYKPGNTCRYVNGKGKPLCIVGVALVEELAVDPKTLDFEGCFYEGTPDFSEWGLYAGRAELRKRLTPGAAKVFQAAQDAQDRPGLTWGDALKAAEEAAR